MNVREIANACSGTVIGNGEREITGVCTDTRKNFAGSLYVALAGDRFDGHDYIASALENGSAAVLWCEDDRTEDIKKISEKYPDRAFIKTENTLKGLGAISGMVLRSYREAKEKETGRKMPVISVTGSVGKTTTKEMTALAFSSCYNVCKSAGNHNNEIGVPLTLLSLKDEDALVTEFGMRGMGQIEYLTNIVRPDVGIITNIGTAHLELLGSRSRIFMAKAEIVSGIPDGGSLVVNGDNDYLGNKEMLDAYITKVFEKKINIYTVGESEGCDFVIADVKEGATDCSFSIMCRECGRKFYVSLKTGGRHNVTDAGLAFAAAVVSGADPEKVCEKLSEYGADSIRQRTVEANGIKIIDDTYNANPESMKAALSVLKKADGRRIAVLGSMLELGEKSDEFHRQVGVFAADCADIVITAGENARHIAEGFAQASGKKDCAFVTKDSEEAGRKLIETAVKGDTVLVKGSRGMVMEKAVGLICGVVK